MGSNDLYLRIAQADCYVLFLFVMIQQIKSCRLLWIIDSNRWQLARVCMRSVPIGIILQQNTIIYPDGVLDGDLLIAGYFRTRKYW